MKAIAAEVERHPHFMDFIGTRVMILSVASLPFITTMGLSTVTFPVLIVLQKAKLFTEVDIACLFKSYPVIQCCAKCLSRYIPLQQCSGCGVVGYCSQACQRQHRTEHGKYCTMLKALAQSGHHPRDMTP